VSLVLLSEVEPEEPLNSLYWMQTPPSRVLLSLQGLAHVVQGISSLVRLVVVLFVVVIETLQSMQVELHPTNHSHCCKDSPLEFVVVRQLHTSYRTSPVSHVGMIPVQVGIVAEVMHTVVVSHSQVSSMILHAKFGYTVCVINPKQGGSGLSPQYQVVRPCLGEQYM
jgi:hypothetical protein